MSTYRINVADPQGTLVPCSYEPSVRAPGKQIIFNENGKALVVEPSGAMRDLRDGEEADSPWCWCEPCQEFFVYRTDPTGPTIVAFRMVESGS